MHARSTKPECAPPCPAPPQDLSAALGSGQVAEVVTGASPRLWLADKLGVLGSGLDKARSLPSGAESVLVQHGGTPGSAIFVFSERSRSVYHHGMQAGRSRCHVTLSLPRACTINRTLTRMHACIRLAAVEHAHPHASTATAQHATVPAPTIWLQGAGRARAGLGGCHHQEAVALPASLVCLVEALVDAAC